MRGHPVDPLLAAWALDAVSPDQRAAVEALLARDPDARHDADALCSVAALLGAAVVPESPPGWLRVRVLADAAASER